MNNKKIKPTYDEVYSAYIIASQERYKYKNVIDKIKEKIKEDITFCENDSQGVYDKCNIQIKRMKNYLELLEETNE